MSDNFSGNPSLQVSALASNTASNTKFFREALKNTPITVFVLDKNLCYTRIYNPSIAQPAEEFIGKKVGEFSKPKDATVLKNFYSQVLKSGAAKQNEISLDFEDETVTYAIYALPLKNILEEITGLVAIFTNVTQRKKAKEEIARLASFPELNPNPIIEVGLNGNIVYCNPATKKVFPTLEEEGLNHQIFRNWKRVVDGFRSKTITSLADEVQVGENWFLEQIYIVPNSDCLRVYVMSIDELKKTQMELEKRRNLLTSLMNGAKRAHLVYLDRDFNFVWVNDAYAKTCGYKPDEMIGKNHFALYPHKENQAIFTRVRDTGKSTEFHDKPFIFPDQPSRGVTFWDWTLEPIKNREGKVDGLVLSLVDTTERKRLQTKLEENAHLLEDYANRMEELANERAKQVTKAERLATIGQTAGMVGHDIRNPLQAIAGDLFLAKDELSSMPDGESKRNIQENLANIEANLFYIDKIVADLQDYTKPLKPSKEKVEIEKAIEESLLIITIPDNLQVAISIEEAFPKFTADLPMLKRVLTNLIQNAVQAMPDGGILNIDAKYQDNKAYIRITDTGHGIPEEIKSKLFTPLFTTKSKGQGFGLAVVKRLIEAQNGEIAFESEEGKGTTFSITLPLT